MSSLRVSCWADREYTFDPSKTALIVIDMQRHFLVDEDAGLDGADGDEQVDRPASTSDESDPESAEAETIITEVVRLVAIARQLGCQVVHTREGYHADMSDVSAFRQDLDYIGHEGALGRTLIRGEPGHDFVDELKPLPGETIIDKASFGAFHKTSLDATLRKAGITHLMLCGVTTQCCVHSTLREAIDHGYWCLTIADCCAASEQELHDAALTLIMGEGHLFGWIADLSDVETVSLPSVSLSPAS